MRTIFTHPDARTAPGFYLMRGPEHHELDPELLARLVPLRRLGNALAVRTRGDSGDRATRRKGYDGPTVDGELRRAGVTFDAARGLWHAYERETRRLATEPPKGQSVDCHTICTAVLEAYDAGMPVDEIHQAIGVPEGRILELIDDEDSRPWRVA